MDNLMENNKTSLSLVNSQGHIFKLRGTVQASITGHQFVFLIPLINGLRSFPNQISNQIVFHLQEVLLKRTWNLSLELQIGKVKSPNFNIFKFQ